MISAVISPPVPWMTVRLYASFVFLEMTGGELETLRTRLMSTRTVPELRTGKLPLFLPLSHAICSLMFWSRFCVAARERS